MTKAICTLLLTRSHSTRKTSAGARHTVKEIFESSWRFSGIVRCPAGHRAAYCAHRPPLKSLDLNFKAKPYGAQSITFNPQ